MTGGCAARHPAKGASHDPGFGPPRSPLRGRGSRQRQLTRGVVHRRAARLPVVRGRADRDGGVRDVPRLPRLPPPLPHPGARAVAAAGRRGELPRDQRRARLPRPAGLPRSAAGAGSPGRGGGAHRRAGGRGQRGGPHRHGNHRRPRGGARRARPRLPGGQHRPGGGREDPAGHGRRRGAPSPPHRALHRGRGAHAGGLAGADPGPEDRRRRRAAAPGRRAVRRPSWPTRPPARPGRRWPTRPTSSWPNPAPASARAAATAATPPSRRKTCSAAA